MAIWMNGSIVDEALVDGTRAGNLLGWGVFTTVGIRDGMPLLVEHHLERLQRDASKAAIDFPWKLDLVRTGLEHIVQHEQVFNGLARITLTQRGDGRWNSTPESDLLISAINSAAPTGAIGLWLSPTPAPYLGLLAGVKTTSYLPYLIAWRQAQATGAHEALLVTSSGVVCECARSNIFWLADGAVFTPALSTGCLEGVGRAVVLTAAAALSLDIHEVEVGIEELLAAEAVFTVSAAAGPLLVDSIELPDRKHKFPGPGALFGRMSEAWNQMAKFPGK